MKDSDFAIALMQNGVSKAKYSHILRKRCKIKIVEINNENHEEES